MSDILRWKEVKTRKPHRCWGCNHEYPAGSTMVSAAYADGGTAVSAYWCPVCQEYMHRYSRYGEEACQGEIYSNDPEAWQKIREEINGQQQ